jgi:hypothetical protein
MGKVIIIHREPSIQTARCVDDDPQPAAVPHSAFRVLETGPWRLGAPRAPVGGPHLIGCNVKGIPRERRARADIRGDVSPEPSSRNWRANTAKTMGVRRNRHEQR